MTRTAGVVRRPGYRLEWASGDGWKREPTIELDLAAVVVLSGRCSAVVGTSEFQLDAPGVVLVNPGSNFAIEGASGTTPYEHVAINLKPAAVDRAAGALGFAPGVVVLFAGCRGGPNDALTFSARRVASEFELELPGREDAFDLAAGLLAIDLMRAHARPDLSARVERSRVGLVDRRLRRAIEFMHDNFDRELSVAEIAAAAYLSEFHFSRLFKRVTGQTPHAYLGSLRLAAAERLLAEGDLSVAEVGARVGYQSASHFTKVFRAATGLTPTAFREALVR